MSESVLTLSMMVLLFAGVLEVKHAAHSFIRASNQQESIIDPVAGSPVEDLQSLEDVDETAAGFDLLDLIATDQTHPPDGSNAAIH